MHLESVVLVEKKTLRPVAANATPQCKENLRSRGTIRSGPCHPDKNFMIHTPQTELLEPEKTYCFGDDILFRQMVPLVPLWMVDSWVSVGPRNPSLK